MSVTSRILIAVFCYLSLQCILDCDCKPSLLPDSPAMLSSNYAQVLSTRNVNSPLANDNAPVTEKISPVYVTPTANCCGGQFHIVTPVTIPDNSSDYLINYPELPGGTVSQPTRATDIMKDGNDENGRSYMRMGTDDASSGQHRAGIQLYQPKQLTFSSFHKPGEVKLQPQAQERFIPNTNFAAKKPSSNSQSTSKKSRPVQLPYQPDFSDSLDTYQPPLPIKSYGSGRPITSYDVGNKPPPKKTPFLPYSNDYVPPDYQDSYAPPKPRKPSKPVKEENKAPPGGYLSPPTVSSKPVQNSYGGPPDLYSYQPPKPQKPSEEMEDMHTEKPPDAYSYNPPQSQKPPKPMEEQHPEYHPEEHPDAAYPTELKKPSNPLHEEHDGPPEGYSYHPPETKKPSKPMKSERPEVHMSEPHEMHDGPPEGYSYHPPETKTPSKPMHEEHPEYHSPEVPDEHPDFPDYPFSFPSLKKPHSKPKLKPHDLPPEKLMPPLPKIPHYPSHHEETAPDDEHPHHAWQFKPEHNEYFYNLDGEEDAKPPKKEKPKEKLKEKKKEKEKPSSHEHDLPKEYPLEHYYDHHYEHYPEHHEYHEHHHHKEEKEKEEEPEDETRVDKRPYSYYYIGRKLWYVPLYFSVYFIIYVAALILKSIARHKIHYPGKDTSEARQGRRRKVDDATRTVMKGLDSANIKYNM